jgi:hypothetical protein
VSGLQWHSSAHDLERVAIRLLRRLFPTAALTLRRAWPATQKAWVARYEIHPPAGLHNTVIVKWFSEDRGAAFEHECGVLRVLEPLSVGPQILADERNDLLLALEDLGDSSDVEALAEGLSALHERTCGQDWRTPRARRSTTSRSVSERTWLVSESRLLRGIDCPFASSGLTVSLPS